MLLVHDFLISAIIPVIRISLEIAPEILRRKCDNDLSRLAGKLYG